MAERGTRPTRQCVHRAGCHQEKEVWQSDPERLDHPRNTAEATLSTATRPSERYHWSNEVKKKSRCCLPSTRGRVALSAEQVQKKPETGDTPVAMDTRQELAHRLRRCDTIQQTLVSRRSDRGRHNSGVEVWKLMRE